MENLLAVGVFEMVSFEMILSVVSLGVTVYFWFVQARKERPCLTFHQLQGFQAFVRNSREPGGGKRLWLTQPQTGGVLVANHSTRQNSILHFECYLDVAGQTLPGHWGYVGDDAPPWNISPESAMALGLCCTFDVPENFEAPDDFRFRLEFLTVSGTRFSHVFSRRSPHELANQERPAA